MTRESEFTVRDRPNKHMRVTLLLLGIIVALLLLAGCSGEIDTDELEPDPGADPFAQLIEQLVQFKCQP